MGGVHQLRDWVLTATGVPHRWVDLGPGLSEDFRSSACALVHGAGPWRSGEQASSPWHGEGAVGLGSLKAACLLVAGAVSTPSRLLGLRHPRTGPCRPWTRVGLHLGANEPERRF